MAIDRKFSDGLPIQLWKTGTLSYNKRKRPYQQAVPWTYNHKCSVEIPFAFIDTQNLDRRLQILKNGEEIYNEPFVKESVTNEVPIFPALKFRNQSFQDNLDFWANEDLGLVTPGLAWNWGLLSSAGAAIVEGDELGIVGSKYLVAERESYPNGWAPGHYVINVHARNQSRIGLAFRIAKLRIYGSDEEGEYTLLGSVDFPANDITTQFLEFDTAQYWKRFCFQVYCDTSPMTEVTFDFRMDFVTMVEAPTIDIENVYTTYKLSVLPSALELCDACAEFKILLDDEEEYYSDSVHFPSETEQIEIKYKADRNTAGIPYEPGGPWNTIFVDAQFWMEREQVEVKNLQLSSTEISTASALSVQRKLELAESGVPDYFRRKLMLALQHSTTGLLYIDGLYWNLPAGVEIKERVETQPLRRAVIWLTEKDYYLTNQI